MSNPSPSRGRPRGMPTSPAPIGEALSSRTVVELFLEEQRRRGNSPRTIEMYTDELSRLVRAYPEFPITKEPLRALIDERTASGVAAITVHHLFRRLRALFRWAYREELVEVTPMERVRPPKIPKKRQRTLNRDQVESLLALPLSRRDHALFLVLLDTGIRSGELVGLRVRDLSDDSIVVNGKTGERLVPCHPHVIDACRALGGDSTDTVFRTFDGRPLMRNRVYKIVRGALADLGLADVPKCGPHLLRHTAGRSWVAEGGTLPGLQAVLGHTNLSTTLIYVSLASAEVSREHDLRSTLTMAEEFAEPTDAEDEPYNPNQGGHGGHEVQAVFARAVESVQWIWPVLSGTDEVVSAPPSREATSPPHPLRDASGRFTVSAPRIDHEQGRVSVADAATWLGITPDGVRRQIRRGQLEAVKTDEGQWFVVLPSAENAVAQRPAPTWDVVGFRAAWWNALGDVAPESFRSVRLQRKWANWTGEEKGGFIRGYLWNSTDRIPDELCDRMGLPRGSNYGRAMRRLPSAREISSDVVELEVPIDCGDEQAPEDLLP